MLHRSRSSSRNSVFSIENNSKVYELNSCDLEIEDIFPEYENLDFMENLN